jgi:hypothetical protein
MAAAEKPIPLIIIRPMTAGSGVTEMQDVLKRIIKLGDLFEPLLAKTERTRLQALI